MSRGVQGHHHTILSPSSKKMFPFSLPFVLVMLLLFHIHVYLKPVNKDCHAQRVGFRALCPGSSPPSLSSAPPETAWSSVVTLRKASTVLSTEGSSPRMPALQRAALERVLLPDQALKTLKGGRQGSLLRKMRLGWSRREGGFPQGHQITLGRGPLVPSSPWVASGCGARCSQQLEPLRLPACSF